jgi:uncharacterized protein (TIGR02246 family)
MEAVHMVTKSLARESDETAIMAIDRIVDALRAAWNRHDAQAFSQCFAGDAEFTNVFGMTAHGRSEIERNHATLFNTFLKDTSWTTSEARIRWIRRDVACVDIRWELIGSRDAEGNPWSPRLGLINFVATGIDGDWLIEIFHNMDFPRAAAAC